MKVLLSFLALVLSAAFGASAQVSDAGLAQKAEALIEDTGAPAVSILVMRDGVVIAEATAGVRSTRSDIEAENGDIWHLGSITKSMTATLAARLVEQGALSWDLTVQDALREAIVDIDPALRELTLEDLFTHTSGLAPNIAMSKFLTFERISEDARGERLDYARHMLTRPPAGTPGEDFAYSNAGYVVAGAMLEQVMGQRWEDLMAEHVFAALDLETAGFGPVGEDEVLSQPRGHRPRFLSFGRIPVSPGDGRADNPEVLGPAGRVHMSLEDLATYATAHLTGQGPDGAPFLSQSSLQKLHTPRLENYAMGWAVREDGEPAGLLWHNGSNTINYAEIYADPTSGVVIAMAANDHQLRGLGLGFRDAAKDIYDSLSD
ncbi:MAG: serine hydrolase domain-containing protein [Pseudomonadota bacterium]